MILRNKQPYKSTNMYHVGASLIEDFPTLNPFEKVEKIRPIIFPLDYPTPDKIDINDFKAFFEKMFVSHYLNNYFKNETFEEFQIQLYAKLMEVMPTYNIILTQIFTLTGDELTLDTYKETVEHSDHAEGVREGSNKSGTESNGTRKDISSAFPANLNKAGTNIGNVGYADSGNLNTDTNKTENETKTEESYKDDKSGSQTREGYTGNRLNQLIRFNADFKSVISSLIGEFGDLFTSIFF